MSYIIINVIQIFPDDESCAPQLLQKNKLSCFSFVDEKCSKDTQVTGDILLRDHRSDLQKASRIKNVLFDHATCLTSVFSSSIPDEVV